MGSGSDFTAFQDFAGIPSLDMGFGSSPNSADNSNPAIYQYHSNYDSYTWMEKFGDPSFEYHATIARVWAVLAAKLVETPILAMNATDYAVGLEGYLKDLRDLAHQHDTHGPLPKPGIFDPLSLAISRFRTSATAHDALAASLAKRLNNVDDIPWWNWWGKLQLFYAIRQVNTKYKLLERQFLYEEGLDGRSLVQTCGFCPGEMDGVCRENVSGYCGGV